MYDTYIKAEEMNVPRWAARNMRMRYLKTQAENLIGNNHPVTLYWLNEILQEGIWLEKNMVKEKVPDEPRKKFTPEELARARAYPVEMLIRFQPKATAWCHNDNVASLHHWKDKNLAFCWPCHKAYGPIEILMQRDGYTFVDAVRSLIGG